MSEDEKSEPGSAMDGFVFVKGGTSTSRYDNEMARRKADADTRRAGQDRMGEIGQRGVRPGEAARLGSQRFLNETTPRIVLLYLNKDKTVRQECISELIEVESKEQGRLDRAFTLVCPRCIARAVPHGEAQMMVRSSHRKFHLDDREGKKNQVVVVRDPYTGAPVPVLIAGTIYCEEILRCNNYNCDWAVKIADSCVEEV